MKRAEAKVASIRAETGEVAGSRAARAGARQEGRHGWDLQGVLGGPARASRAIAIVAVEEAEAAVARTQALGGIADRPVPGRGRAGLLDGRAHCRARTGPDRAVAVRAAERTEAGKVVDALASDADLVRERRSCGVHRGTSHAPDPRVPVGQAVLACDPVAACCDGLAREDHGAHGDGHNAGARPVRYAAVVDADAPGRRASPRGVEIDVADCHGHRPVGAEQGREENLVLNDVAWGKLELQLRVCCPPCCRPRRRPWG